MMNFLLTPLLSIIILAISLSINSYPLTIYSNLNNLSPSQIDHLCSYISDIETKNIQSLQKRIVRPFPEMNRFLSTSHKLHHHHHHVNAKSGTEVETKKYDFQAYLCSILKDSEEMTNFISIFMEEHGQTPAIHLFESCEKLTKRQVCSSRVDKQLNDSIERSITNDFMNQIFEEQKVKSYPYSNKIDSLLV
ncbi:unnamed protein product [Rotaria sp. Silwood1]|nr:unnamed protein product [Rotaria sp. Silwood1]